MAIWIFPRADHFSAGICGKLNGKTTAELRRLMEECVSAAGLAFTGAKVYAHVLAALSLTTLRQAAVSGDGWAMIGDAAGFSDSITEKRRKAPPFRAGDIRRDFALS